MSEEALGFNAYLSPDEPTVLRYVQCGVEDAEGLFTGLIRDYVGGGEQAEFYFLDGEELSESEEFEEADADEIIEKIQESHPELFDRIWALVKRYAAEEEDTFLWRATEAFTQDFPAGPNASAVRGTGTVEPIEVGLTGFGELD